MATRHILDDVVDAWRRRGAGEAVFESVGGVDAMRRVLDGEAFDAVVLSSEVIDKLIAGGRILPGSRIDLARSSVAIAVRTGAARPAIGSEPQLREAILSARALGYSTGPSGRALLELFTRWGIADAIRARLVQAPPGVPVGELLARGEVDLGFQQRSELLHVEGIEIIGPMPPGLEIDTTFSGGVGAVSIQPVAARSFLDFARSSACAAAIRRHGMEPIAITATTPPQLSP